jgi:hypothetical protein
MGWAGLKVNVKFVRKLRFFISAFFGYLDIVKNTFSLEIIKDLYTIVLPRWEIIVLFLTHDTPMLTAQEASDLIWSKACHQRTDCLRLEIKCAAKTREALEIIKFVRP